MVRRPDFVIDQEIIETISAFTKGIISASLTAGSGREEHSARISDLIALVF